MYDASTFSEEVIRRWGTAVPGLSDDAGLLHCQMSELASAVRTSPAVRDEILGFLEQLLQRPDTVSEIENAIAISFLDLSEARQLDLDLPHCIERVLTEQQERYTRAK